MTYLKLLSLTIILNILRYFPGGFIESYTIFESMHKPMELYPGCFGFTAKDLASSYAYNYFYGLVLCLFFILHIDH